MNRVQSIDVIRLIAITAVIAIHTTPFDGLHQNALFQYMDIAINQVARFAVPFFFIMAGYFFSRKLQNTDDVAATGWAMFRRLLLLWLCWSLIYLIPFSQFFAEQSNWSTLLQAGYDNVVHIVQQPVLFLMQGSKIHLWFLIALAFATAITTLAISLSPRQFLCWLVPLAIVLYVIGMLAKAYSATPWGIQFAFDTRNGPFFSLLFFVSGIFLAQLAFNTKHLYLGLGVLIAGLVLHFAEIFYLYQHYHIWPARQEYVLGTYFMGLGAALIALSNHKILQQPTLATMGRYTLGIYAIHFIYVDLFAHIDRANNSVMWQFSYIALVFGLSLLTAWLLAKHNKLRVLVF